MGAVISIFYQFLHGIHSLELSLKESSTHILQNKLFTDSKTNVNIAQVYKTY